LYPGAKDGSIILNIVKNTLQTFGCDNNNTIYAQSVCPDEINHRKGDITNIFAEYFGKVFHIGGLAGIPFTGKTGD